MPQNTPAGSGIILPTRGTHSEKIIFHRFWPIRFPPGPWPNRALCVVESGSRDFARVDSENGFADQNLGPRAHMGPGPGGPGPMVSATKTSPSD